MFKNFCAFGGSSYMTYPVDCRLCEGIVSSCSSWWQAALTVERLWLETGNMTLSEWSVYLDPKELDGAAETRSVRPQNTQILILVNIGYWLWSVRNSLLYNTVEGWAGLLQEGTALGCVIQMCTVPWGASGWRGKRARGHISAVDRGGTAEAGSGTPTSRQSRTAAPGNPGGKKHIMSPPLSPPKNRKWHHSWCGLKIEY